MRCGALRAAAACALVAATPAGGARAQDADAALDLLRGCLDAAEAKSDALACAGAHVRECTATAPDGDTTAGIVVCAMDEAAAWERILDEAWADLVILAKRRAVREADGGASPASDEEMLRAAQTAWIAFRDADCAQEHAVWAEGSMARIAGAFCMLDRSAVRAVELRAKRDAFGDG
jgi:uncharacterized protein YecT (DUF1311 family)